MSMKQLQWLLQLAKIINIVAAWRLYRKLETFRKKDPTFYLDRVTGNR